MKQITVTIDETGDTAVEMAGFQGKGCHALQAAFEKAFKKVAQGKHAFMMGSGLRLSEEGNWRVLDAKNPFTHDPQRKQWDKGYDAARKKFYKDGKKKGGG